MDYYKVPLGFGLALSRNPQALNAYSAMTQAQRDTILDRAHNAQSEKQMNQIVNDIIENRMQ